MGTRLRAAETVPLLCNARDPGSREAQAHSWVDRNPSARLRGWAQAHGVIHLCTPLACIPLWPRERRGAGTALARSRLVSLAKTAGAGIRNPGVLASSLPPRGDH